jgi:hypothetical protein
MQAVGDQSERTEQAAAHNLHQHHHTAKHNDRPCFALVLLMTGAQKHVVVTGE